MFAIGMIGFLAGVLFKKGWLHRTRESLPVFLPKKKGKREGKKKEKFRIKMSEFHLQIKKMCYNIAIS